MLGHTQLKLKRVILSPLYKNHFLVLVVTMKESPVKITPEAAKEVLYILQNKNIPEGYALRVGMKGAGCSGAGFFIGFDTKKKEDEEFDLHGIQLLLDKRHIMYLLDLEVDFQDREDGRGFVFNKPDAL